MPAPESITYAVAAYVAAHTAVRDLIDGGATAGYMAIKNGADAVLATIPLADPCGTINGTTGRLTFNFPAAAPASVSGTAAYADFCSSANTVIISVPCEEGTVSINGNKVVLNSLNIIAEMDVAVIAATIG